MKINIIGRGNVGTHLRKAFEDKADVVAVDPHTLAGLDTEADLTIVSVSDSAIAGVLLALPVMRGAVAHTSGSTGIGIFETCGFDSGRRYGVLYPLQTFSKEKQLDYSEIPFFIEAGDRQTAEFLKDTASLISRHVMEADSERRRALHIAAVFACNFTNHLWAVADSYLHRHGMDISVMLPLIRESAAKIESLSPALAQTGPAARNDRNVIENHIARLECDDTRLAAIYRMLTESIINMNDHRQ